MDPLTVIISEIPCTPCRKTSSARRKASWRGVCSSAISSRRSLGITIRVSTFFCNFSIASNACKHENCLYSQKLTFGGKKAHSILISTSKKHQFLQQAKGMETAISNKKRSKLFSNYDIFFFLGTILDK